jgi:hypothetical protein
MSVINHFKIFVLCSGDVTTDVYQLHVKGIHLESLVGQVFWMLLTSMRMDLT